MIKTISKLIFFLLLILTVIIFYLSYFGIKTNKFNDLINQKITKNKEELSLSLEDVKLKLNLKNLSIELNTDNPNILFNNKKIELTKVSSNYSIKSFINKNFAIENLQISTKKNSIKDFLDFARLFQNNFQMIIIEKLIKKGTLVIDIDINFDKNGSIKDDYKFVGSVNNAKLNLINNQQIDNINFDFEIKNKLHSFNKVKVEFEKINFSSNQIKIINQKNNFLVEGDLNSSKSLIDVKLLSIFFSDHFNDLDISNFYLSSKNKFILKSKSSPLKSFKYDSDFKFTEINVKSKILLNDLKYNFKSRSLKNYITDYNDLIEFDNHKLDASYINNKFSIKGQGIYSINNKKDNISYNVEFKNGDYFINSQIDLISNPIQVNFLNYKKLEKKNSVLDIDAVYKKNKYIQFNKLIYKENKNRFIINNLLFNNDLKIEYIDKIDLKFNNQNQRNNQIIIKRDKKNYKISGKSFDSVILIDKLLNSKVKKKSFDILNNFNSEVSLKIDKSYLDNSSYLKKVDGKMEFLKNDLVNLDLSAVSNNDKKFSLSIKINDNNEKITTLYLDYPKPLVKKYKFIKGFEEGSLDFTSVKKDNFSRSQLKIHDFKLKEVPILTKILTLASLQGIADLLTGEGVRFDEFDMKFSNKDDLMTIDEIYAIGPAISILMNGYAETNKLISLRGTLVPATTINKVIASIPILGNILIGKKNR